MMKEEILQKLNTFISEERKIEFLENMLAKPLDKETKVAIYFLLSEIYEKKKFYDHAVKYLINAEKFVTKYNERIPLLMKIAQLYVKLFDFINAEEFFNMAKSEAPDSMITALKQQYYSFYLQEAELYEAKKFYRKAIRLYDYLLKQNYNKLKIMEKMAELYDKAAMPIEANRLRRQIQDLLAAEREKALQAEKERAEREGRADMLV
jgi:tetratricopeptide (TPR) repeat protein